MARPKVITDLLIQQMAVLSSEGMPQGQIEHVLGVSQSSISRGLKEARKRRILEDLPVCRLSAERIRELKELIYAQGLTERLKALQPSDGQHLREVHIVDIGERSGRSPADYDEQLKAFGRTAAGYLTRSILPEVEELGVAWGKTLQHLVEGAQEQDPPPERQHIDFFPVCGIPPEAHRDALRSSPHLVGQLERFWNDSSDAALNFAGVAACIPRSFSDKESKVVLRFFQSISGYRRVFGADDEPGEIDKVDTILTSVGGNCPGEAPWLVAAAEAAETEPDRLAKLAIGNIGGVFLPRPTLERGGRKLVADINDRWTGIRLEHFLDCARKAAAGDRVGVVVVASGNKTDILVECVRRGLVSVLVIDQHLAAELAAALAPREA